MPEDSIVVEVIERPLPCTEEACDGDAAVRITSDLQNYDREPFCAGHAQAIFASWISGA